MSREAGQVATEGKSAPPDDEVAGMGNSPWHDGQRHGETIRWFAVYTAARAEAVVAKRLTASGFNVWYPHVQVVYRRGRNNRRVTIEKALFSRYLFVGIRQSVSFGGAIAAINNTHDVSTVVHLKGNPLEIPIHVMEELMARADTDGLVVHGGKAKKALPFEGQVGNRVKIDNDQAFGGLECEVTSLARLEAHGEIGIWLNFLGGKREVFLPTTKIGKIVE